MTADRIVRMLSLLVLAICLAIAVTQTAVWAGVSPSADSAAAPATDHADVGSGLAGLSPSTRGLLASLTIFVLAMLVGFDVITKVPPTLHTPLMSGSNAISGITVVGALVASGSQQVGVATWLGTVAVAFAMINVVGGFLVTHRMLKMFKKK
jgi:H+-translocating NAD(P) transhydrogenase subunit alpha